MNDENSKPNYFVRILIVILVIFCGYLVFTSFTNGEPIYTISATAFSTLVLMTIIGLSEAFNHLSLGKILSLSKKVTEEKTSKEEVKKENADLRESLLKLSIAMRQTQTNTTINALPSELLKYLGVTKADEKDKAANEEVITPTPQETLVQAFTPERELTSLNRSRIRRLLAEDALEKCLKKLGVPDADLSRDVTFTSAFQNIDPIMERPIVFDAYLKTPSREQFFEAIPLISSLTFERTYVMLAKILFYRQAKQVQAELVLVISKLPDQNELQQTYSRFGERFLQAFQPAISNNLLRVEFIDFSETEFLALSQKATET